MWYCSGVMDTGIEARPLPDDRAMIEGLAAGSRDGREGRRRERIGADGPADARRAAGPVNRSESRAGGMPGPGIGAGLMDA